MGEEIPRHLHRQRRHDGNGASQQAGSQRRLGVRFVNRRTFVNGFAATLAAQKLRIEAAGPDRNILWACSTFLWTSTQWKTDGSAKFTDMLDVIKDTGLNGIRLNGWPQTLQRYNMPQALLEKELSR